MRKAFTLVELAIVLVIIGLLVGGVLQGQELIERAKLQKVAKNILKYESAYLIFKHKYGRPPGDLNKAWAFFGSACASAAGYCNGNGDRLISRFDDVTGAFPHLILAGLIEGGGITMPMPDTPTDIRDYYIRDSSFEDVFYGIMSYGSTNIIFGNEFSQTNYIQVGIGLNGYADNRLNISAFTPEQAYYIDDKIDDGIAGAGKLLSIQGAEVGYANASACSNAVYNQALPATPAYHLTNTARECEFFYRLD